VEFDRKEYDARQGTSTPGKIPYRTNASTVAV
jgi:hypothetical protein